MKLRLTWNMIFEQDHKCWAGLRFNVLIMQEMRHSADVLAAGILEMADPELSTRYFRHRQPQVRLSSFSVYNYCRFIILVILSLSIKRLRMFYTVLPSVILYGKNS